MVDTPRGAGTAPGAALTWERHPADVARLVAALLGLVLAAALMAASENDATSLSSSLIKIVGLLPSPVTTAALGLAQLVALTGPIALVVWLVWTRRLRLTALVVLAGALGAIATTFFRSRFSSTTPQIPEGRLTAHSWITGALFPSPIYLAGAAAVITVLVPMLPRRWRRAAWLFLIVLAGLRLITAVAVPTHVATALLLGISIGSALLVAVGAPRRRPGPREVGAALRAAGIAATHVDQDVVGGFRASLPDGTDVALRVADRDDRDADLLFRLLTSAQRRGIENERFSWSPERTVEHEALVTLLADRAGVPVRTLLGIAKTEDEAGVVVYADRGATSLLELSPAQLTDARLDELWAAVDALQEQRIAHGQLRLDNVYLAGTGSDDDAVVLGELDRSVLSAPDDRLAIDVAELLVSTALVVGPARAVAAAQGRVPDQLARALPLLQPLALTPTTRRALRAASSNSKDLLSELRDGVQRAAGVDEFKMAELQRISVARAVSLIGAAVLFYVALAFVANWSAIASALSDADWVYLPVILVMSGLSYPAGGLSLMGAVTGRLPFTQTSEVMLAQAFLNRFTPANIGGMALRTRYLQNNGVDLAVAASSVGLTSVASGATQVVFILGFVLWSGSSGSSAFSIPDASTIAVILLVVLAVGGILWLTPLRRRLLDSNIVLSAGQVWENLKELAQRPGKVALLFGGAALGKMVTIIAFTQSCRALGIDLPFAQLGALYLTANTVASAAPTPGGVGAIEAALIAVLTGAGVEPATALSAVLVFRLATYWLPVPPSWLALRQLRAKKVV